jgi:hypothetical protein
MGLGRGCLVAVSSDVSWFSTVETKSLFDTVLPFIALEFPVLA